MAERVYDFWEPVSSGQNNPGQPMADDLGCYSCHRIHENIDLFRTRDRQQLIGDPVFSRPHFGLHPGTCFATAFDARGGEGINEIFLFPEEGDRLEHASIVCATCHVMSPDRASELAGILKEEKRPVKDFIRQEIAGTFCKTCHGTDALVRFLYFHSKW